MKVTGKGDTVYEIAPEDFQTITGYKELAEIERVFGADLTTLRPMQAIGATVWTLCKRQDPTCRVDDIDFDISELPQDDEAPKENSEGSDDNVSNT